MALLHKIRILENERIDKPDHDQIQEFVADDFKAYNRHFFTDADKWITKGFIASVTSGLNISVTVQNCALFNTEASGEDEFYLGESGHAALTTTLTDNSTNYVHLEIVSGNTGTSATRVFWDPSLNSGAGGEFLQTIDTEEYLDIQLSVSTSGFSSDADKIPLCTMVTVGGSVTSTIDNRNLYFRLGKGQTLNAGFEYALGSPSEPASSSFTGGDKDIASFKDWMDLVMTRIKNVSGETSWFVNTGGFNVTALYNDLGNMIMNGGGTIGYTGANVFNFSADLKLDLISSSVTYTIPFATESGQTLADGQVAYINIDAELGGAASGKRGTSGPRDLVVANRSAVPFDQDIYWIAYRTGTKLFVRGMRQELEQGEESQIGDGVSTDLLTFIGSTGETDNAPNYSSNHYVTDSTSLVTAIGALDAAMFGLDHGGLSGLSDDDHSQYILVSGTRAFTGDQSMGSHKLTNLTDPASAQDAVTLAYYNANLPAAGVTDHGALTGLGDDDHPQYGALAQNETVAGSWTFNNASGTILKGTNTTSQTFLSVIDSASVSQFSLTSDAAGNGIASVFNTSGSQQIHLDSGTTNPSYFLQKLVLGNTAVSAHTFGSLSEFQIVSGNPSITMEGTDGTASGPSLLSYVNSASPAAGDILWVHYMYGRDSAGNQTEYNSVVPRIRDTTDGVETSSYVINILHNGTAISALDLNTVDGVASVNTLDFAVDSTTFYVDSVNNRVYIGDNATTTVLSDNYKRQLTSSGTPCNIDICTATGATGVENASYHNSSTPADNDTIFTHYFIGNNSTAVATSYARMEVNVLDVTDTTEDSEISFATMSGGTTVSGGVSIHGTVTETGNVRPAVGNTYDLGTSSLDWDNIYSVNALNVTSDKRLKEDIQEIPLGLDFINELNPVFFKWKSATKKEFFHKECVDRDGVKKIYTRHISKDKSNDEKRFHSGFIAQEVEVVMKKYEVDFGLVCHDQFVDKYTMRKDELIPILAKAVQELSDKIDILEGKIK